MLISSYAQWRDLKIRDFSEDNPFVDCPECDGDGEILDICGCCEAEKEYDCGECGSEGRLRFNDLSEIQKASVFTRRMYFGEVMSDLKRWCSLTREDYLGVAGRFVDEFRREG